MRPGFGRERITLQLGVALMSRGNDITYQSGREMNGMRARACLPLECCQHAP